MRETLAPLASVISLVLVVIVWIDLFAHDVRMPTPDRWQLRLVAPLLINLVAVLLLLVGDEGAIVAGGSFVLCIASVTFCVWVLGQSRERDYVTFFDCPGTAKNEYCWLSGRWVSLWIPVAVISGTIALRTFGR